ncbi:hypothetical protein [Ornithinimicrobium tianjinense]|uniref:SipW-cognate class signal peptide n=1 Tax=Ornithinimicrobium tianjinense TaxID=1195761 RepID=A0A917BSL5_9MICO|nr:hypothetical protein [Ornithinimicrobium tianjinense]GGF57206.1 hypothetical protein GCM10011366_26340 [Ornithinimicrobium tianjinense]
MPSDLDPEQNPDLQLLPVRHRPDLVRFLVSGALLGAVLGGVIGYFGPDAANSSLVQEVVLLAAIGAIFVGLLAAVVYLVADRASRRV